MAKQKTVKIPQMKVHKPTGQAYIRINGRRKYLGKSHLPETDQEYRRVIVEYLGNGGKLNPSENYDATIAELCAGFLLYAKGYYKGRDGEVTSEVRIFKTTIKILVNLYGDVLVRDFGSAELECVQQWQVFQDHSRQYINKMTTKIKRIFKWGLKKKMVNQEVFWSLKAVEGLRKGHTDAPESKKVKPVSTENIEAVKEYVAKQVWAMIQLQRLTGARSGEIVIMRAVDIDMSRDTWEYCPKYHKTDYKDIERKIFIGPKAQEVLMPFLRDRKLDAYLFSPREADIERRKKQHSERKTPMSCGNKPGTNIKKNPKKKPGERYSPDSYRRAITYACKKANIDSWSPHQLRHTAATYIREHYGLEAAQHVLGHKYADVTQIYAEANYKKAIEAIREVG